MPAVSFRALPVVLTMAVGLLPMAPSEHVHETTEADGHHEVVAHRHVQLHKTDVDVDAQAHHDSASIDHEDTVVATLDSVFTAPNTYVPQGPALVVVRIFQAPVGRVTPVPVEFIERLIHGPPRAPTALRGPPISLSL
jgi:hypothetical protein